MPKKEKAFSNEKFTLKGGRILTVVNNRFQAVSFSYLALGANCAT